MISLAFRKDRCDAKATRRMGATLSTRQSNGAWSATRTATTVNTRKHTDTNTTTTYLRRHRRAPSTKHRRPEQERSTPRSQTGTRELREQVQARHKEMLSPPSLPPLCCHDNRHMGEVCQRKRGPIRRHTHTQTHTEHNSPRTEGRQP